LTSITIGANVTIDTSFATWEKSSYISFPTFYNKNGKKAGVYTYSNNKWSYKAR
jgi:hypothetical protein